MQITFCYDTTSRFETNTFKLNAVKTKMSGKFASNSDTNLDVKMNDNVIKLYNIKYVK